MLEQLFSSKTRVKLLKLFLNQKEDKDYFIRELTRVLGEHLNSIRRELTNLEDLGLVLSQEKDKKKYYSVNKDFILLPELKALLLKSRELGDQKLVQQLEKIGFLDLLILSGTFVGNTDSDVDLFIVGRVQKPKLDKLIQTHEKDSGKDIRYTLMSKKEFQHRIDLGDRFIYTILNSRKITVINKLGI
jgi:DNA-binding transcriptional ArsR family regulator